MQFPRSGTWKICLRTLLARACLSRRRHLTLGNARARACSVIARANSLQPEFNAICLEVSGAECSGFSCQRGQIVQNCAAKTLLHMRNHGEDMAVDVFSFHINS
jgi:hypothetical protein